MFYQELQLSATKPNGAGSTIVNYSRKDQTVVNYRWGKNVCVFKKKHM